jgi:hypothetical protein
MQVESQYLFILWFLLTASDAVGALIGVAVFRKMRLASSRYQMILLVGIAVEATVAGASLLLWWREEYAVAPAFAIARSFGRGFKMLCVWAYVAYYLGFINGVGPIHRTLNGERQTKKE